MGETERFSLRAVVALVISVMALSVCYPQSKDANRGELKFRPPMVLKLHVDERHFYEETFDRVPYVADNDIYLFAGDDFGINVVTAGNQGPRIAYQKDIDKADVEFKFTQDKSPQGFMMLLVIRNKMKRKVFFDALMTLPSDTRIYKTSVLPVEPELSSFESWPHPIVQLVLRNVRFSEANPITRF